MHSKPSTFGLSSFHLSAYGPDGHRCVATNHPSKKNRKKIFFFEQTIVELMAQKHESNDCLNGSAPPPPEASL